MSRRISNPSSSPVTGAWSDNVQPVVAPIRAVQAEHSTRRVQLELLLETTPRDSRYSSELVEMMKREETLLGESQQLTAPARELISKIERALADETSRYFLKTAAINNKRWVSLGQTLEKERERLKMEYFDKGTVLPEARQPQLQNFDLVSDSDLDAEMYRLDEVYNRNWLQIEGFHLTQAFDSQSQRVEKDWAVHESAVREEFITKKRLLVGPDASDADFGVTKSNSGDNNGYDARWQHPEKQKTLIHTAPVLAPTTGATATGRASRDASGSTLKSIRSARSKEDMVELERLEKVLKTQLETLERQKENAHRWMNRQKIRLMAQAEAVQEERTQIGELIRREREFYNSLAEAVTASLNAR